MDAIKDKVATAFVIDATDEQSLSVLPLNSVDVVIVAIGENFGASVRVNAVWTEKGTDEWLMQVESGKVISCSRTGGMKGWQLYSVSRWTAEDGIKLKKHLEEEFENKDNRQIYWDDVAMFCHFEDYDLGIMPMQEGDIVEIDNLEELIALDSSYEDEGRRQG